MTTQLAAPADTGLVSRSIVLRLAAIEARRFARHPLFLVGLALVVLTGVSEVVKTPPTVGALGL
ncbi:MAG TPA: hypothetical protein VF642_00460, partial [Propionibacteriaceae bacterium]